MNRIRPKLTYANVVSTLALIAAVGGGTTAIAISGKVRTGQIQNGNVTAKDLARIKVREASAPGTLAQGAVSVSCAKGERLIGGGGSAGRPPSSAISSSRAEGNRWEIEASAIGGGSVLPVAQALCLSAKASK